MNGAARRAALAEQHLAGGRHEAALHYASRALAAAPHPQRQLLVADALRGLGREAQALRAEPAFEQGALANRALERNGKAEQAQAVRVRARAWREGAPAAPAAAGGAGGAQRAPAPDR
jgi:hypothetical protein